MSDMYGLFYNEAKLKGLEYNQPEIVPPDFSYIKTDKEKLYSITTNLIKNALKYTNEGFVTYHFSVGKSNLVFSVTDSGIGIPKDKTQLIFDRFTQINSSRKKTFEGAGLGLAIAKAYVDMLGGEIQVESEEGEGSTFTVTIPVEHVQPGG
jgi:signal transduction histidine kinase